MTEVIQHVVLANWDDLIAASHHFGVPPDYFGRKGQDVRDGTVMDPLLAKMVQCGKRLLSVHPQVKLDFHIAMNPNTANSLANTVEMRAYTAQQTLTSGPLKPTPHTFGLPELIYGCTVKAITHVVVPPVPIGALAMLPVFFIPDGLFAICGIEDRGGMTLEHRFTIKNIFSRQSTPAAGYPPLSGWVGGGGFSSPPNYGKPLNSDPPADPVKKVNFREFF